MAGSALLPLSPVLHGIGVHRSEVVDSNNGGSSARAGRNVPDFFSSCTATLIIFLLYTHTRVTTTYRGSETQIKIHTNTNSKFAPCSMPGHLCTYQHRVTKTRLRLPEGQTRLLGYWESSYAAFSGPWPYHHPYTTLQ